MLLRSWSWIDTIQFKNCENFQNCKTAKSQSLNQSSFSPFFLRTFNFDLLQFYSLLSHMDSQYLIWNSSKFFNGTVSSQEHNSTFKIWYLHSKYIQLCGANFVGVCRLLLSTVCATYLIPNIIKTHFFLKWL